MENTRRPCAGRRREEEEEGELAAQLYTFRKNIAADRSSILSSFTEPTPGI